MGKKGGGGQTTTQKTELPPWINQAAQENLRLADRIAAPALQTIPNETVAPFSEAELTSHQMIQDYAQVAPNFSRQDLGFDVAQNIATGPANTLAASPVMSAVGFQPSAAAMTSTQVGPVGSINAQKFTDADLQSYMNPYLGSVVDSTQNDLNDAYRRASAASDLNAAASGAFGGGRHGIRDAQVSDDYLRNVARTMSGLRQQGFDKASQLIQADQQQALQAATANQANQRAIALENARYADAIRQQQFATDQENARRANEVAVMNFNETVRRAGAEQQLDQSNKRLQLDAARQMADAAVRQQQVNDQATLQRADALGNVGAQQRAQYQALLDAPAKALQLRTAALGATPYPTTSTTTTTNNASGKGGLNGILSVASQFASHSSFKTEIEDVTVLSRLKGLGVKKWKYREEFGDPRSHIGPFAEDFKEAFGVGDGMTINVLDAFGVCLAAIQELSMHIDSLLASNSNEAPSRSVSEVSSINGAGSSDPQRGNPIHEQPT